MSVGIRPAIHCSIVTHEDLRAAAKAGAVFDHPVAAFIEFIGPAAQPGPAE